MPVFAPIGAALFGAGTFLAGATAFVLQTAVGVGLNLLAKSLGKQDAGKAGTGGVEGTLQAGGDIARSIMLGRRVTAGSLVYANTWGKAGKTPNAYFTQVIALSDFPIAGINAIWVNGEPVTVNTGDSSYGTMGYPVAEYAKGSDNHLWVKFYDGTQTVADPFLTGSVSSAGRPYDGLRIGEGVAYAIVTAQADDELFTGFPTFRFEVQGAKLYDVSKDSTNGGAGSHRWTDQSTWGGDGDDLPAVQIYNILRGLYYDGAWLYGLQTLTEARLPSIDWIQQINKCRAGIAGPGGTETTYLTSLEVSVHTEIGTTIESLLTGCQGRVIESGGIYKIRVGEPDASVFTFSDGDILSTEEQSFTPFFGLADTVNGVSATYPEPDEAWNTKTAPPLYNADYQLEDGARRLMTSVEMDMVYRSSQVQRIMKSALAEARRARRLTFVLPPAAWILEPGDVVTFTSNRNGFEAKLFRIDGVADHANLDVTVDLTEVDPTDYDWDQEHDYTPPVFAPIGPVRPPAQPLYGWQVEPAVIYDSDGNPRRPSIEILCAPDQDDVRNIWVQVRLKSTGAVIFDSDSTVYADPFAWILNGTFLPNTLYQARGKFVPYSNRATEWSEWLDVTTPNVLLGEGDVYLPGVVEELQEFVGEATDWIRDGVRQTILEAQRVAMLTADQDMGGYKDVQTLRRELVSTSDGIRASYTEEIVAATGPTSALSARIETVEAIIPNLATASSVSLLSAQVTTVDGKVTAQASAITALSAGTVNGDVATANFRMSVSAGPAGYASRIGMEARAGGAGGYRSASLFLDVPTSSSDPTRVAVVADQFSVTNGGATKAPFIFQSGVLYANELSVDWAKIVNATIGWANIATAVVNNFVANTANIGDLTVSTIKIAYDQITTSAQFNYSNGAGIIGDLPGTSVTLANVNPSPVKIYYSLSFQMDASSTGTNRVQLVSDTDGTILADHSITKSTTGSTGNLSAQNQVAFDLRPGAARNQTYHWRAVGPPTVLAINLRCVFECMKR